MADVHLRNIRKSFGKTEVLHGISIDIASGQFVSLLGASGCGKTTLLRIVAGLEAVTSGTVNLAGEDVTELPPEQRDIAMMFQSYALLPHMSVLENVRFPLRMRKIGAQDEQQALAQTALETVQLTHLAERKPRQLSGGQQQRVALARAIVSKPRILLLDEPLSNLDARLREDMQVELIEIHRELGLTTLFVTHDQEEALSLSDRIVLLHDGKVEQEGEPHSIYSAPSTAFASSFLGASNLLPATIGDDSRTVAANLSDGQIIVLNELVAQRGEVELAIRQEEIDLVPPDEGTLRGKIRARVFLGSRCRYVLEIADTELRVLSSSTDRWEPGDAIGLAIDPARVRVLGKANKPSTG